MPITQRDIAVDMIENPDNYGAGEMVEVLVLADDEYSNEGETFIDDGEYDALRLIASRLDPSNVYFTGIGSEVRGGKIKLPYEMGSLNQVEIGNIEEWIQKHNLVDEKMILTDKMDGTSALIVYGDDGLPQIAYSRGNGTEGADISRHIFKIKNVPEQVSGKLVVRVEVELTETAFRALNKKITRHSSKSAYKNARNMVAGIMNRKENPDVVWDYVTVVAYQVVGSEEHKLDQLDLLQKEGFDVTPYFICDGSDLTDEYLATYLNAARDASDYALDGIVIDVNRRQKRAAMNPNRDTLNPEYSVKYKVADESNLAIATVRGVTWNVSKHGFLKPQVNIEPVELVGVTVSNATGFNARYIVDNGIGAGAKIKITRSGDVIPFILDVVESATPDLPSEDCVWNETNVDLVLADKSSSDEVVIGQLVDFFAKIEAPMLKEGNVRKLYAEGYETPEQIIQADASDLVAVIGENGNKVYVGLQTRLTGIPVYKLAGAYSTERGLGVRKFKKLQAALGFDALLDNSPTRAQIVAVDGFDEKSAEKALTSLNAFGEFMEYMQGYVTFEVEVDTSGGSLVGEKIVFTGFRDADLGEAVEKAGGEIQSGVSGKTTILVCKDPNSNSGKVKKARDKGVRIIGLDEMKGLV